MFNLKNLFVILTLFWSGQSLIASVVRVVDEEQWLVKPSKPSLDWYGEKLKTSTDILPPLNSNSFIQRIVVAEYDHNFTNRTRDSFLLKVEFRSDLAQQNKKLMHNFLNSNFNQRRLEAICGLYCCYNYECTNEKDFPDFLKIFYDANVIPDSVVDIIIPKLQTIDFRLDTGKFIK